VRFFVLMFAAATSVLGEDVTLWGPEASGLQLGIDVSATSEPALRVSLKNAGAVPRDLAIGYFEGYVDLYSVEIAATAPGRQQQPVFDVMDLKARPASLQLPINVHLRPGEVREFLYPLSQLICVVNRKDIPFRALWERGYTVRAWMEFPGVRLATPDLSLHR
jgi:hypothetical protein